MNRLVVGNGVGGNLEVFFLSSQDGPSAREAGQEVFKNPLVKIYVALFDVGKLGWKAETARLLSYSSSEISTEI